MAWEQLRDAVSIVGVGNTDYARMYRDLDPRRTEYELGLQALGRALGDAGLEPTDVDGLITLRIPSYARFGDLAGLTHLRFANLIEAGGRFAGLAVQYAAMAIHAGLARCIAIVYANNGRSVRMRYGGDEPGLDSPYDRAAGMTSPGAYMAMMFRRHQAVHGSSDDTLFEIARLNRAAAAKNPNAVMRAPLTRDEYFDSRFIVEPLRLYDYCLVNDGAACMILMKTADAQTMAKPPVKIHASATGTELRTSYASEDSLHRSGAIAADELFSTSSVKREDVNCLMVYENYSPLCLFTMEAFGYAPRGEGARWILDGNLEPRADFAYNTSGGQLSESYMQGWGLQIEAVRQLRGEAGDRQIPNCEVAHYACLSTITSSHLLTV
jgi:acetyl-CoA acetyltransferase